MFLLFLAAWAAVALIVAITSDRWVALTALPAALIMLAAARSERLSQSAQLAWPVIMLPGATFVFIGFMQAMGYGRMENEPTAEHLTIRATFFAIGLLLHLAAFALLATESRASDHPGGEISDRMP